MRSRRFQVQAWAYTDHDNAKPLGSDVKYNLVCDESGTASRYLIVGALTLPRINHPALSAEIRRLKESLGFRPEGEVKWGKVSIQYLDRYVKIMNWFFEHLQSNHLLFRAHVVDTVSAAYRNYGSGDTEESFYKICYHLLFQSVRRLALEEEGSNILILMDDKRNRRPFRLDVLKRSLNAGLKRDIGISELVANVEPRPSSGAKAEPLIQIVDVLIGAIGYVRNGGADKPGASPAKLAMTEHLQQKAGTGFAFDTTASAPFNLWTFDVTVAMKRRSEHKTKNRPST